jgi:steroid delta-isomerase-like uncharacterized protein
MPATVPSFRLDPAFLDDWRRRYFAAWDERDADAMALLCTEDVVWEDPGLPAPVRGRRAVADFVAATARAFPDFAVLASEPPVTSAIAPRAYAPYRMTGTFAGPWVPLGIRPTGRRFHIEGIDVWTFRGELMCQYASRYDSLDMTRQIGVLPSPDSRQQRALNLVQRAQAAVQRRRE